MTTLPDKYPTLFATIEPNARNFPVDESWGIPEREGGHFAHEAAFLLVTGVQCTATVIDGKYVPGLDLVAVAQIADLMYVVGEDGKQTRPERPDTSHDCPSGHGKMKRIAAINTTLGLAGQDGRKLVASVPVIDVPTCLKCGAAVFDEEAIVELNRRVNATLQTATMTSITVAQNPETKQVAYVRRLIGPNIQLLDPKTGIVHFPTLNEAFAAVPKGAVKVPEAPNEIEGVVGVWMIETAKIPTAKQFN